VDGAARAAIEERGFGEGFKHPTGHGVGFAAIDHNAIPRIHPQSGDRLEPGMVFNVEPAIYIEGLGGLRHCDMVAVTENGMELLTPFHATLAELALDHTPAHVESETTR
jgi:Xaa-Pro dipeptidase